MKQNNLSLLKFHKNLPTQYLEIPFSIVSCNFKFSTKTGGLNMIAWGAPKPLTIQALIILAAGEVQQCDC
jgi:hypothetical protein